MTGSYRQNKAKIVATLGPASSTREVIAALVKAGADVFRLNFSHGSHAEHKARYDTIRAIEQETGRPIGILADLQGPKLRIGPLAGGPLQLVEGEQLRFDLDRAPGSRERVPLPHPEVFAALKPGVQLLVDDGKIRLEVEEATGETATARVLVAGPLSERKGVSVVGAVLPVSALTDKDRQDLAFALSLGVDWVALSFVQRPEDMDEVRELVQGQAGVLAKLEKPSAIECLDEIVARSDAIMVARGDLGVEMAPEKVPIIQRRILRSCRAAGKPVIVATQMLESMITAPTPTRAEASDVATAVYDGADAVMLSAESAAGKYPVEAVRIMDRIIAEVEADPDYRHSLDATRPAPEGTIADVICYALRHAAAVMPVKAIATYTTSGSTTLRAARERPLVPILGLTPDVRVARRLCLTWGTYAVRIDVATRVAEIVGHACETVASEGLAHPGEIIAIAAGHPFGVAGTTNLLRIEKLSAT
ncbi:MAG TPA: pyruvate kinase [Microvirga sp.]|nr:pyruvate kinase [Microvirga sp.]